jgi:O-antigen/teichoic acid export membrane protein
VSSSRVLARNTLWYGCVTVLGLVAGLLMSVVLARGLGPERLGDFSYASWFTRLLEAIAAQGLGLGTVRYTADAFGRGNPGRASGFLRLFTRAQVVMALSVVAIVVPLVLIVAPPALRVAYLAATLTVLPLSLEGIYMRATYGAQRYDLTARASAVKMTLHLVVTALVLKGGGGVAGVLVAQGVVTVFTCLLQRQYARSLYTAPAERLPAPVWREARSYIIPLAVVLLLEMLVWDRTEIFFLRLYVSSGELAFYSLAYGLAGRLIVLPNIVVGPLLPALAALHGTGDGVEFRRVYRRAVRYAMLVAAPLVAVSVAGAPGVVGLLYGERYAPVTWMFRVLVIVTLIGVLREVAWAALQAAGARRSILYGALVSTVLDLVLAVVLIPRIGTVGALVAASSAQIALTVWAVAAMRHATGARLPGLALVRIVTAGAVACGAALAVPVTASLGSVVASTLVGAGTFVVVALALGVPEPGEWQWMRDVTWRLVGARVAAQRSR